MARPCTCEQDTCRLCYLFSADHRYRDLWEPKPVRDGFDAAKVPERVYLLNLKRRPDKLVRALAECHRAGLAPIIWDGLDGHALGGALPEGWDTGPGSYGCLEGHRRILERCILDGIDSVLVLEDDVTFLVDDFKQKLAELLPTLPPDCSALFLGGQHKGPPQEVRPDLLRPVHPDGVHRTQSYLLLNNKYIRRLYSAWSSGFGHCDHLWGKIQASEGGVYCVNPWWTGQAEGKSDITKREEGHREWQPKRIIRTGQPPRTARVIRPCNGCGKAKPA